MGEKRNILLTIREAFDILHWKNPIIAHFKHRIVIWLFFGILLIIKNISSVLMIFYLSIGKSSFSH